ncbi:MAG: sulfur carrier protein ThiS [Janthinobacterium lividum]
MQTIDAVQLVVNGEPAQVPPGTSVEGLLDQLKLDRRKVAVELNEAIVPRSTYADATLRPGDRIEIVHFIGGG